MLHPNIPMILKADSRTNRLRYVQLVSAPDLALSQHYTFTCSCQSDSVRVWVLCNDPDNLQAIMEVLQEVLTRILDQVSIVEKSVVTCTLSGTVRN